MTSERLWALQGGLIVFGKGVPIISDPLVFPNKDSNVDTNSCPEEFIMKQKRLKQTQFKSSSVIYYPHITSNKLFYEPQFLLEHTIPKSQWLKTLKIYFLLAVHVHQLLDGNSARCLLAPGSWLMEQPPSNYRTLLVTVVVGKEDLESLTSTTDVLWLRSDTYYHFCSQLIAQNQ